MLRESGALPDQNHGAGVGFPKGTADADVIDALVGIAPGSPLDAIRARRPEARTHAQATYRALFAPEGHGGVTAHERFAVASFVAGLHGGASIAAFYAEGLAASGASAALREAVEAAIAEAGAHGPYGSYPAGPLSREDMAGPAYRVGPGTRRALGLRLAAAFEHVHLLVFHPRDATPVALQALLDAGWSTTDVVTLSQIVAFLSFQIRVVAGLLTIAGRP
jgi:CMD domain protein